MSKADASFGGVKIFNERSSEVYVQVQMVAQQGGSVVLRGDSTRKLVPANTTVNPVNWGLGVVMPPATCVLVTVYDSLADNATVLASFGPKGVQCKYDGAARNINNVEVRVSLDGAATPAYCRLVARMYFRLLPEEAPTKSVTALMQSFRYVNAAQTASTISTRDCTLRVGVDAKWPNPNAVQQATQSTGLHQQWKCKASDEPPAQFHVVSLIEYEGAVDPAITALTDGTSELTTSSLPTPGHELLLVQYFHGDGVTEVEDGWQIVSAADGRLLSSTSVDAQPLKFLPPNDPDAVSQFWSITPA